jgi:hypothetical protein
MKKIVLGILLGSCLTVSAYTVKFNDINLNNLKTNEADNVEIIVENLTSTNIFHHNKIIELATTNKEFLAALNKSPFILNNKTPEWGCYPFIASEKNIKIFPTIFDRYCMLLEENSPNTAKLMRKYKTLGIYKHMTIQEFLDVYAEKNTLTTSLWAWYKEFSAKFIPIFKKHLRDNGKSFVVREVIDEKGNKTFINPMAEYTTELSNILNNGRLAGINKFLEKLGMTERFDETSLPSEIEIKELQNKIMYDEIKINNNILNILKKCLSVDNFNVFIKEYNEGTTK